MSWDHFRRLQTVDPTEDRPGEFPGGKGNAGELTPIMHDEREHSCVQSALLAAVVSRVVAVDIGALTQHPGEPSSVSTLM